MSAEFTVVNQTLIIPVYNGISRSVEMIGLHVRSGAVLWHRDLNITSNRYYYGNLLEMDSRAGSIDFYLPGTFRNNRTRVSSDGSTWKSVSHEISSWPVGAHRYQDLVFGFHGDPLTKTVRALVPVDDRTGVPRWRFPTPDRWTSPPVLANDLLVFTTGRELVGLDPLTGQRRWSVHLRGEPPPGPAPPMVTVHYVLLTQGLPGAAPLYSNWIVTRHDVRTGIENGAVPIGERIGAPRLVQRLGSLVAAEGDVWVDIIDPAIPALRVSTSFESTFSRFVLATPRVWVGSADERGFLIVTSDGKLRYYDLPLSTGAR